MSVGLRLLRSVVDNGSRSAFRLLDESLFIGDEVPVYQFIADHYRRYGQLPAPDTFIDHGITLPTATDAVDYYAHQVRDRAIFNLIRSQTTALHNPMRDRNMAEAMEIVRSTGYAISRLQSFDDVSSLPEVIEQVMDEYREHKLTGGHQGITLGWSYLDSVTNGAEPGDVVTLVARPGMGKSWNMIYLAQQAWLSGASVLFVTMEMTGMQIARRFIGLQGGFNPDFIRRGQMSKFAEDAAYEVHRQTQTGAPFHMLSGSFQKSVAAVDAAVQEFSPDIVYIDASYLMAPSGQRGKRANHELLSDVGKEVKEMALARRKPVVQSVQFNREAKKSKTPDLTQIGGSDAVGQISTIVLAQQGGDGAMEGLQRKMTLLKNREGTAGVSFYTNFLFTPPNFSFDRIATEDDSPDEAEGPQQRMIREGNGSGTDWVA